MILSFNNVYNWDVASKKKKNDAIMKNVASDPINGFGCCPLEPWSLSFRLMQQIND